MREIEKPSLGIQPEKFWKEDRLIELDKVIGDRLATTFDIPIEWVIERNRLLVEIKGMGQVNERD